MKLNKTAYLLVFCLLLSYSYCHCKTDFIESKTQNDIRKFYSKDIVIAIWIYKNEDVIKKEGKQINGFVKDYYKNEDNHECYRIINYKVDKPVDGKYKSFYLSGKLEGVFNLKDGKHDNLIFKYYENGKL